MKSSASIVVAVAAMLAGAMAGAQTTPAVPAAPVLRPLPPSQWTPLQIRQSFELADSDANGQLTRAEAQQLTIMPRGFEEMDENKDGVISRAEYESVFTPR